MIEHIHSPEKIAALEQEGAKLLKEYQQRLAALLLKDRPAEAELREQVTEYLSHEPAPELVELFKTMRDVVYFPTYFEVDMGENNYHDVQDEIDGIATPFTDDNEDPTLDEKGGQLRSDIYNTLGQSHLLYLKTELTQLRAQSLLWEKYHPGEDPVKNAKKAFAEEIAQEVSDNFTSMRDPLLAELSLLYGGRDRLEQVVEDDRYAVDLLRKVRDIKAEDDLVGNVLDDVREGMHPTLISGAIDKYTREQKIELEEKDEEMKKHRAKLYEQYKKAPKPLGRMVDWALETKNGELPVHVTSK